MLIQPLAHEEAKQICNWRYDGEYSFYDIAYSPDTIEELTDGSYYSVTTAYGAEMIGFFCLGPHAQVPGGRLAGLYGGKDVIDVGIGMRPDLVGQGRGADFLAAVTQYTIDTFQPRRLRLSVAAFNRRAIALYTKAGYRRLAAFDNCGTEFWLMLYTRPL
ncbi:GNAT family N-acetyltransferase [Paenibacillus harenae]|uniref:RimJ/RimL family protein N-acetyltransferase n=1 Tax=Paenibacillus harenae TaxID=306543 RepID=A0ABT9TYM1_PAEHA|nr:GNAT family protein [Paenibacillus harenae]MDQ0111174.1 RimJ/RimL family protein N-acetyltransferase [Paenibacillus harenae]